MGNREAISGLFLGARRINPQTTDPLETVLVPFICSAAILDTRSLKIETINHFAAVDRTQTAHTP